MVIEPRPVSFTLDTNCLIDVAEERPSAVRIRALLTAWEKGNADLALVASSASERQSGDYFLQSVDEFNRRREALGFGDLPLLPSIGRMDVSFFGHSLWGSDEDCARERAIYSVLFPNSPPEWADYAEYRGVDSEDTASPAYLRWRNQMLDAQALWAHDYADRDIFVTSDHRLRKLDRHVAFPKMAVRTPEEAVWAL